MPPDSTESEIMYAEQQWNAAIANRDLESAKSFMADDYVLVGVRSTGASSVTRNQWLDGLAGMKIHDYKADPVWIRIYGDAAVVSVEGAWHITFQGREIDENFLLTDVWARHADRWQVVLRHSSPYPRASEQGRFIE